MTAFSCEGVNLLRVRKHPLIQQFQLGKTALISGSTETNGDLLGILTLPFCLSSLKESMFIRWCLLACSEVYTVSVDHVINFKTVLLVWILKHYTVAPSASKLVTKEALCWSWLEGVKWGVQILCFGSVALSYKGLPLWPGYHMQPRFILRGVKCHIFLLIW